MTFDTATLPVLLAVGALLLFLGYLLLRSMPEPQRVRVRADDDPHARDPRRHGGPAGRRDGC